MTDIPPEDLAVLLDLERELTATATLALRDWLEVARAAVLPALTAAAIPPDPDAIGRHADAAWDRALDDTVLPKLAAAVSRLLGDAAERLSDWRTRYVGAARARLSSLPERAARRVRTAVKATAGAVVEVVRAAVDTALSWQAWEDDAAAIGRNEAVAAFNASRLAAAQAHAAETGVRLDKQWTSLHDAATRHTHVDADRQRVPLDQPFRVGGHDLMYPHDPDGPIEEIANCVPGWVRVSADRATATVMRRFDGVLIEITTALGHELAATANHSVLTRRGWRPVGALQPGDEIACSTQARPSARSVDPDVADREPLIEECARAMQLSGGRAERMASGFVDLDGDVADSEVQVQRSDLPLTFGDYAVQLKQLGQLEVHGRDAAVRLADHESSLLRVGHTDEGLLVSGPDRQPHCAESAGDETTVATERFGDGLDGFASVPSRADLSVGAGGVGGLDLVQGSDMNSGVLEAFSDNLFADPEAFADHRDRHQLDVVELHDSVAVDSATLCGGAAQLDSCVSQAASENVEAHAEVSGDAAPGLARLVPGDDLIPDLVASTAGNFCWVPITHMKRRAFNGHVYDLSTESGLYLTEGVVSHNCRCVLLVLNSAPQEPAVAASAAQPGGTTMGRRFEAMIIPTGEVGRSQGWMLARTVELVDTALPLAMKWQRTADPGHDGAYTVAVLETLQVRDGAVWGTGVTLDSPEAAEAIQQIEAGVTRPSVELVARSSTLTDAAGNPVDPATAEQMWLAGAVIVDRVDVAEIVAATLVSVPEFRDAHMVLGDELGEGDQDHGLALVAAAAVPRIVEPDLYPAGYFGEPDLSDPADWPIHVTADGRVQGLLATWTTEHTAYADRKVRPYHSHSGYADFHQSTAHLDNGETLRVGRLTVGAGHAPAGRGMRAAVDHYDNVSTCWALVRAGENEHGIWVSGVIHASADEAMVKLALGTPHSGHWERVGGHPELIAAHAVNSPGFPIPAVQRCADRDGDLALVASFAPRPSPAARPPLPASVLEDIAERGARKYAEHLAAAQRAAAVRDLITAASDRRRARVAVLTAGRKAS